MATLYPSYFKMFPKLKCVNAINFVHYHVTGGAGESLNFAIRLVLTKQV
jgi:hypothetical protein